MHDTEERETIFDYMEMLDTKFLSSVPGMKEKASQEFKECDGVQTIFKDFQKEC